MRIDVVTLFPAMFQGVLGESILKIAQEKGAVEIRLVDLRDYTTDKHRKVDAPPYGGGPGMVIMADPVFRAIEKLRESGAADSELVLLSPAGRKLDQRLDRKSTRLNSSHGYISYVGYF